MDIDDDSDDDGDDDDDDDDDGQSMTDGLHPETNIAPARKPSQKETWLPTPVCWNATSSVLASMMG